MSHRYDGLPNASTNGPHKTSEEIIQEALENYLAKKEETLRNPPPSDLYRQNVIRQYTADQEQQRRKTFTGPPWKPADEVHIPIEDYHFSRPRFRYDYDYNETPVQPLPPFIKFALIVTELPNLVLLYYGSYWCQIMHSIQFAFTLPTLIGSIICSIAMTIAFSANSFGHLFTAISRSKKKRLEDERQFHDKIVTWLKDPLACQWQNNQALSHQLQNGIVPELMFVNQSNQYPRSWDETKDIRLNIGVVLRFLLLSFFGITLLLTAEDMEDKFFVLWPRDPWTCSQFLCSSAILPLIFFLWRLACMEALPLRFDWRTVFYNGKLIL